MVRGLLLIVLMALTILYDGTAWAAPKEITVRSVWSESMKGLRYGCGERSRDGRWLVVRLSTGKRIQAVILPKRIRDEVRFLRSHLKILRTKRASIGHITRLRALIARMGIGCSAPSNDPSPNNSGGDPTPTPTRAGPLTPTAVPGATVTPITSATPTGTATAIATRTAIPTATRTPTPTMTPPPGAWPTVNLTGNCIAVMNADTFGSNLTPIQIGRPFIQGEISQYPTATENGQIVPTQAHVQSRWADGSVKHAILIFYLNLARGQTKVICFGNQNTSNNGGGLTSAEILGSSWNFDARTTLSASSGSTSASARTAILEDDYYTWFSGTAATSIVIGSRIHNHYDLGVGGARPVKPIWYVTFYPHIGAAKVRFSGETTNSQTISDITYDLSLSLGQTSPQTVYQRTNHKQYARTVWSKEFWLGNRPPRVAIKHNIGYLAATTMLPNYDASITVDTSRAIDECTSWINAPKEIGQAGRYTIDMGTAGGRDELGLLPRWTIMYLYTGSLCLAESMYGHADLAGSWSMFLREGDQTRFFDRNLTVPGIGRYLTVNSRPSVLVTGNTYSGSTADRVVPIAPLAVNPWKAGWAHMPEPFAVPWLLSGDKFYLELLHGQAFSTFVGRQPGNTWITRGPYQCFTIAGSGQTRSDAWLMRTFATAAAFSPDNTAEKAELKHQVECLISGWAGAHNIANPYSAHQPAWNWANTNARRGTGGSDCGLYGSFPYPTCRNPFSGSINFWGEPADVIVSGQVLTSKVVLPWQYNYLIIALARAKELGFATDGILNFVSKFTTDLLVTPGFNPYLAPEYYFPSHDPVTREYLSTLSQAMALYAPERLSAANASNFGVGGVNHSYPVILYMALEMMGDAGQAVQARAQYRQMMGSETPPFQLNPQWAVKRRN